jgi:hypothetical protein
MKQIIPFSLLLMIGNTLFGQWYYYKKFEFDLRQEPRQSEWIETYCPGLYFRITSCRNDIYEYNIPKVRYDFTIQFWNNTDDTIKINYKVADNAYLSKPIVEHGLFIPPRYYELSGDISRTSINSVYVHIEKYVEQTSYFIHNYPRQTNHPKEQSAIENSSDETYYPPKGYENNDNLDDEYNYATENKYTLENDDYNSDEEYSSDEEYGKLVFWTTRKYNIDIYIEGDFVGTEFKYRTSDVPPDCDADGYITITKKDGTYSFYAKDVSGRYWKGQITIVAGECRTWQLR